MLVILGLIGYLFFSRVNRFTEYGFQVTGRDVYWLQYLELLKERPLGFLFGVNLYNYEKLSVSLHSSFVSLHKYTGIIGCIIFAISLLNSAVKMFNNRNFIFLVLMTSVLVRMSVDNVAFWGMLDPIILYFLLYSDGGKFNER